MTEMHLDLCIQSTAHLLETVSSIKENLRMLEVFLNSGLQIVDFNDPIGLKIPSEGYSYGKGESREYSSLDSRLYQYMNPKNGSSGIRHLNCCCMCSGRIQVPRQGNCRSGTMSRASVTTVSNSSNTNSSRKKAHITPRLNKTASLRRAKVLQRISSSARK